MRILVLTFYFAPDLSAGSFRATALVDSLRALVPAGSHIDVISTLPNRYQSFAAEAAELEEHPGLSIRRIRLPRHRSGMLDQSASFVAFARGALTLVRGKEYDVVFATSSRLMTSVLGTWIAGRTHAKSYLDVRDIFVDTIRDVLPGIAANVAGSFFGLLEGVAVRGADRVTLVSEGFLSYFRSRYPDRQFGLLTNGIDDGFLHAGVASPTVSPRVAGSGTVTVVYAGNVGEGQGLHRVVPPLAKTLGDRVRFRIIGDGGRRAALEAALIAAAVDNVELVPPMGRSQLIDAYRSADVLFLHLNDHPAFEKVLPSKLFEYGAMGKPVWAGVAGFAAAFVRDEMSNAVVFEPCDVAGAIDALGRLVLEDRPRDSFIAKYARTTISRQLAQDVIRVGSR